MPHGWRGASALLCPARPQARRRDDGYGRIAASGPRPAAKLRVLRAWIPAFCAPLNGVTVFGQPLFTASVGLPNHRPRWYWLVGWNVTLVDVTAVVAPVWLPPATPPCEIENVSSLKIPRTVTLPLPVAPVCRSL